MKDKQSKFIIGRKDKVDFPDLKLQNIDAKADTGAYTSSIHCSRIDPVTKDGTKYVQFKLLDSSHPKYQKKLITLPVYKEKVVKNSFGESEQRYIVKTTIRLFKKNFEIELSLTNREKMTNPVLLGRKLLSGKFVVDVNRYNLSYKNKSKKVEK